MNPLKADREVVVAREVMVAREVVVIGEVVVAEEVMVAREVMLAEEATEVMVVGEAIREIMVLAMEDSGGQGEDPHYSYCVIVHHHY